jgi:hypothetical protein
LLREDIPLAPLKGGIRSGRFSLAKENRLFREEISDQEEEIGTAPPLDYSMPNFISPWLRIHHLMRNV